MRVILYLVLLALAATGCQPRGGEAPVGPFVRLASPAAPSSGQPRFTSDGGRLFLSWVDREDATAVLRFAERTASGWREPVVAARGEDWFVNWADTPGVVALGGDAFAAFYLQRTGDGTYDYAIRVVQSSDGGRTWDAPVTPHTDEVASEFGFVSAMPEAGRLRLVWLDGAALAGGHAGAGAMAVRTAVLGRDGTVLGDELLDDRTCECCNTAVAATPAGPVIAYRDRSPDEIRDIAVVRGVDGDWTEPVVPHEDGWRIEGCPVNGPAMASAGDRVVLAWFTGAVDANGVRVAFSEDGGGTFDTPVRVDAGRPLGRVDVVLTPSGAALVSWMELAEETAELRVRRVEPDGSVGDAVVAARVDASRATGMPRLALHDGNVFVTWVETGEVPHVALVTAPVQALE